MLLANQLTLFVGRAILNPFCCVDVLKDEPLFF